MIQGPAIHRKRIMVGGSAGRAGIGAALTGAVPMASASAFGAAIRWKVIDEIPTPYVAANEAGWSAIDAIAGALAEEFGVTSAFIGVRLRKYGLIR
jgi:hypothetical protein